MCRIGVYHDAESRLKASPPMNMRLSSQLSRAHDERESVRKHSGWRQGSCEHHQLC